MHAGLLSLWVTGVLLLRQCLGDTYDDYDYETVTPTAGYTDYTDYSFVYESDGYSTTSIDYDLYVTPSKGIKHPQSTDVVAEEAKGGMNQINDKASTVCRYFAVGLGLIVQRFCQQS